LVNKKLAILKMAEGISKISPSGSRHLVLLLLVIFPPMIISFHFAAPSSSTHKTNAPSHFLSQRSLAQRKQPVLGPIPFNGTKPVFGQHKGTDAIFALACKYPVSFYKRFVGSLRKFGYEDDIVLAVSPPAQMKPGVEDYVKKTEVVAYGFDVNCAGKDNCRLKDDFLG
jgi:hypothetical protein